MTRSNQLLLTAIFAASTLFWTACSKHSTTIDPAKLKEFAGLPVAPTYRAGDPMAAKVDLGRMLYYDARLSRSQSVSCNSCHPLAKYGVDGKPASTGHAGQLGSRNSPTVYNAAMQFAQFWDGRAPNVEVQAQGPLLNPVEMAMPSQKAVVDVVRSIPAYVVSF